MAKGTSKRVATVSRKTAETDISITLAIDGTGVSKIDTGVAFFDHMLTLFAKHGLFDLTVKAKGDVDVDYHHTVEDVGLVLGQAFKKALGRQDRDPPLRLLHPADGRVARARRRRRRRPARTSCTASRRQSMFVRDFNLVLVKEFCRAFSNALGANLHVELVYGEEPHHIAEAVFKGLGRALDAATQIEPRAANLLPSTKGSL